MGGGTKQVFYSYKYGDGKKLSNTEGGLAQNVLR